MLPSITDELLNVVFSDEFLDEMMDAIFVKNEQTEFEVNVNESKRSIAQEVTINYESSREASPMHTLSDFSDEKYSIAA